MTGFGFYETLRVFVPGVLAVVILDFALRLVSGDNPLIASGPLEELIQTLESAPGYIGASLVVGLLLYQIDIPSKLRIHKEGDPSRGYQLPSDYIGEVVPRPARPGRPLSIYFILSDTFLPPELHRRIYLFGSLYRIYVDLRVLMAMSLCVMPAAWLYMLSSQGLVSLSRVRMDVGAVTIYCIVVLLTAVGGLPESVSYLSKAKLHGTDETIGKHIVRSLGRMKRVVCLIALLLLSGFRLVMTSSPVGRWLGIALVAFAFAIWLSVEVGPPRDGKATMSPRDWLLRPVLPGRHGSQYPTTYRLAADLSLVASALVGASLAGALAGRSAGDLLAWALLTVPFAVILGFRKHEVRLLNTYADQVTWLRMHQCELDLIARSGLLGTGRMQSTDALDSREARVPPSRGLDRDHGSEG